MAYGFDLGRLKSASIGASFLDRVLHTGGTTVKSYSSEALGFAKSIQYFVTPGVNVPATTVPSYPSVVANLSGGIASVTISGGNISVYVVLLVR